MTGHAGVSGFRMSITGAAQEPSAEAVTGQSGVRKLLHQGVGQRQVRMGFCLPHKFRVKNTWHWAHKLFRNETKWGK